MIQINSTPNFAGVSVSGDIVDLHNLYDSLHTIVGSEGELGTYETSRDRVLAVCYDMRHAFMGDRNVEFVENGLNPDIMRYSSIIGSDKNIYFSFNILWPELIFVTMALNNFVKLHINKQAKGSYNAVTDYRNIWDPTIAQVRVFQAAIAQCIVDTIPETSVSRVIKMMNFDYFWTDNYATQYIDELNCKFIAMDGKNV